MSLDPLIVQKKGRDRRDVTANKEGLQKASGWQIEQAITLSSLWSTLQHVNLPISPSLHLSLTASPMPPSNHLSYHKGIKKPLSNQVLHWSSASNEGAKENELSSWDAEGKESWCIVWRKQRESEESKEAMICDGTGTERCRSIEEEEEWEDAAKIILLLLFSPLLSWWHFFSPLLSW